MCTLKTKGSTKRTCAAPDTKNQQENHALKVAKKYVETYSSSNAAAQYPEERVN